MALVLIIDDEEMIRSILREVLERAGHEVTEASNGREGLQRFRACPTDLVITDLQMPETSGLELISELRRDFPRANIIALSGSGAALLTRAKQLGAQCGFEKPIPLQGVLTAVQALVPSTGLF